ncbi:type VI secretion system tip protein TssI/VgrG [Polyangium sp. 15x6]|uniref:type VI secretion system Vgr family protein n=1 Tax=Polyangium sp. 15x6 TaxID=3042687 RepID=UPI00249B9EAF|nr:type VI secretion system tip protein TssI/VgrG [Polyangium sp. 15x6]MDI3287314.1 type VI secretion system tip protein TssI/VgrG [Polyangium sp. 15x6]
MQFAGAGRSSTAVGVGFEERNLSLVVGSGDALDVRRFDVAERMSSIFEVKIVAVSENHDIDFEAVVGQPMSFTVQGRHSRTWTGVCNHLQQIGVEERGLSTYELSLVPTLWLLTQRRNQRMFQQMSEIDIVQKLLGEWGIEPTLRLTGTYKKRKYRVQYGETDETFIRRMLEDAGVSFYFDDAGGESRLVLDDGPQRNEPRSPIAFRDKPTVADAEHVTAVCVGRRLRPGKVTVRDHDYRRPSDYKLLGSASGASGVEARMESFHYTPGAFLVEVGKPDGASMSDGRGQYRADEGEGAALAQRRLDGARATARMVSFQTNAHDLAPGRVLSVLDHPKSELAAGKRLLVVDSALSGTNDGEWSQSVTTVSGEAPYRPEVQTPAPKAVGVESATVVGPPGEEIHVDEFGRVCVHFHWDRESQMDEKSSCWIHVSQPWGGAGFGGSALPRVGQEVIVDFLNGDPDRPVIIGRVYTNLQKTPYKLPENKTQTGLKSNSTSNTGGYNEIMFEDAAGKELVRMQAEKDLKKLVKNDENVKIGRDREKKIGRDDSHDVARDRQRSVGRDENVSVGQDRTRSVGRDESLDIGRDQVQNVGQNKDVTVGQDLTKNVGSNERETTGQNRTISVGQNRTADIGLVDSTSVGEKIYLEVKPPEGEAEDIDDLGEVIGIEDGFVQGMASLGRVGALGGSGFAGGAVNVLAGLAGGAGGAAGAVANAIAGVAGGGGGAAGAAAGAIAGMAGTAMSAGAGMVQGGAGGGASAEVMSALAGVLQSSAAGGGGIGGIPGDVVNAIVGMLQADAAGEGGEGAAAAAAGGIVHALAGRIQGGAAGGSGGAEGAAGAVMNAMVGMAQGGGTGGAGGAAGGVMGAIAGMAQGALGGAAGGLAGQAMSAIAGAAMGGAPAGLGGLTGMLGGMAGTGGFAGALGKASSVAFGEGALAEQAFAAEGPEAKESKATPTSVTMVHKKITITTGAGATITMDGAKVTIEADTIEFFAKNNIEADAKQKDVSIHAKTDIALKSDQTVHVATKKGAIVVNASGGNVTVDTNKSVLMSAASSFMAKAKMSGVIGSSCVLVDGGDLAFMKSTNTLVQGTTSLATVGENATHTGEKTLLVASPGETKIVGAPVNINPEKTP